MKSIFLLVIFTIPFLMVNIEKKIKLLLISIFVLPFFYSFFGILPNGVKLITDIYLLLFLFEIIFNRKLTRVIKYNKLTKFTFIYIVLFSLIFVLSSIANGSNILLSLLEYRKIIFPLLFLFVLNYYSILKNRIYDFEPFLKLIFLIQFILIPLQYIFYDYYIGYLPKFVNKIDCATGTFGMGTSMLGVFIVSYFMYTYIKNNNSPKTFLNIIPLAFVFSGGANVFLIISLGVNQLLTGKKIKGMLRFIIGSVLFIVIIQLISSAFFKQSLFTESYYYITKTIYKKNIENQSPLTSANKLSRFRGPDYAVFKISQYDKKLFGFGNDVYANSTSLEIKTNKFNLGEVINLVPELILKYGYFGLAINVLFYFLLTLYFLAYFKKNVFYQIGFNLLFINLLNFMYTKPIYQNAYLVFVFFVLNKAELTKNKRGNNAESICYNSNI